MKVKIGGYLTWVGAYQLADMIPFISEDTSHKIGEYLSKTKLQDLCEWIYSKRKRTISIKIDTYDTWGMDSTLALIILPMLKQLKATKHGSPLVDDTDVPWYLSSSIFEKESEESWNNLHKKWVYVLDEIIWTFEQLQDATDWEERYRKETNEKYEGANAFLGNKWDFDRNGMSNHQECINNGLRLFGKYYQGLWD
jgi:hypothetical protein